MGKTILTSTQRKVLSLLSKEPLFVNNFYFTGGTVLAEYYLKYRLSEDLDFFSIKEIDNLWLSTLTKKIKNNLGADKIDLQQSFNRNLVFITIGSEVLKTEFTYFPFPQIEKPKIIEGIKIDSLIDIAVNKFFTIYQKPSARHFIDLYLILKTGKVKWEDLARLARNKFDTVIDPLQLGSQLIMASDVQDLPQMIIDIPENDWKEFFLQKAKDLKPQIAE